MIEAAFLFQLVLGTNVKSQDILDREGLIHAALTAHMALLANVPEAPLEGSPLSRLVQARDSLRLRVEELDAFQTARLRVERRYFDGAEVEFPRHARRGRCSCANLGRQRFSRSGLPNSTARRPRPSLARTGSRRASRR